MAIQRMGHLQAGAMERSDEVMAWVRGERGKSHTPGVLEQMTGKNNEQ